MNWIVMTGFLLLAMPDAMAGKWQTYEKCILVEEAYFDGDSFHVKAPTGYTYVFRLYGVDCPETDKRFPDRITEQMKEFRVSRTDLLKWGGKAKQFTGRFLSKPFTVHTKKEMARGTSEKNRYYCVIIGAGGERLDEALLKAGLARAFGQGADWPAGLDRDRFMGKLHPLESKAKRDKQGIWGG